MRSFLLGALFSIVSVAGFSRRFQPVHGFGTGGPKPGGALDGGKPKSGPRSWGKGFSLNDDGAAGGGKSGGATTPSTAPGAKAPGGAVGRGQTLNPLPGAKNPAPVGGPQGVGTAAANTGAPRGTAPETPPKAQREREVAPTLSREDDQKFKTVGNSFSLEC